MESVGESNNKHTTPSPIHVLQGYYDDVQFPSSLMQFNYKFHKKFYNSQNKIKKTEIKVPLYKKHKNENVFTRLFFFLSKINFF